MSFHNLLSKCDRALAAYLVSQGSAAGSAEDILPMKLSADKTLPCSVCYSRNARPEGNPYSGIYLVQAVVMVRTQGSLESSQNQDGQPASDSDARVSATFDAFHVDLDQSGDQLGQDITAAARSSSLTRDSDLSDFTIMNVKIQEIDAGFEAKGDAWVDALHLEILCCPSDVGA